MESFRKFHLVLAASMPEFGIGCNGSLPWHLPEDMKHFKQITSNTMDATKKNAVIMGRKTWESIPSKFRPLQDRINVVLTRNTLSETAKEMSCCNNTFVVSSFEDALKLLDKDPFNKEIESIFIIGGSQIYNLAISNQFLPYLQSIYLTKIFESFPNCDTFFKVDLTQFKEINLSQRHASLQSKTNKNMEYQLVQLLPLSNDKNLKENDKENTNSCNNSNDIDKKEAEMETNDSKCNVNEKESESVTNEVGPPPFAMNIINDNHSSRHEEYQYLSLIDYIIKHGITRNDRTGTGTKSIFGATMRFSLKNNQFPLLTTKRVFWRGVCKELLWFIKGSTNANELSNDNIHIWDENGSRSFLDSRGLTKNEEGDLGPVYGFQWRHFGSDYKNCKTNYKNKGIDQLKNVINTIKNDPNSRRIILTAWNPSDLNKMALPPCHMFCQFYVSNNELSCQMYQRSADMGLGVPFNIASYSLLTKMIANVCGLKCNQFIHCIGDCHVYLNHIEPLKEQLKREPKPFPTLEINPNVKDIDDFVYEDFKVVGYQPHKTIKMKMAV